MSIAAHIYRLFVMMKLLEMISKSSVQVVSLNMPQLVMLEDAYRRGQSILRDFRPTMSTRYVLWLIQRELVAIEVMMNLLEAFAQAFGGTLAYQAKVGVGIIGK